jgi:UDP-glucose 4-epimerase
LNRVIGDIEVGESSKVLVTGGAGFIGSYLVDGLISRGFKVRVVDNLSSGNMKNLETWLNDSRFELFRGDLKDQDVACRSVHGVEVVFHLAANPEVRLVEASPSVHFRENLLTTFNILEAMRGSEAAKLIVFFSSSTVYGEPYEIPTPEDYSPLVPVSIYGASKLGCEALISSYCNTFGLKGLVLRLANIVGGRSGHGVIVDFVRKLQKNSTELEILGDGSQSKSYLYIGDLVEAVFVVLESFLRCGKFDVYNAGSLDRVDVGHIAEIVCDEMGLETVRFRFTGGVDGGRGWKGDVKTMLISTTKLLGLGWRPKFNSEEAIRQSCREFLTSCKQ